MFKEPDLFNAFFVNNPYRWNGGRDLLINMAQDHFNKNKSFNKFMHITHDNSNEFEIQGNKYIQKFVEIIYEHKPEGFQLELNYLKDSKDFSTPLGLRKGIKTLFKDYSFPEDIKVENLSDITNYYDGLSENYGYKIDVPFLVLLLKADKLSQIGKTEQAVEIYNYMIEHKTGAENAYWQLGNMSMRAGDLVTAKNYIGKMLEMLDNDIGMIKSRYDKIVKMIDESAAYALEQAILKSGLEEGKNKYKEISASGKLYFNESELNTSGYRFLNKKMLNESIFIFKINTEKFPKSANAFDSYAEACMISGKKELAIKNYKKSLELNPENKNA